CGAEIIKTFGERRPQTTVTMAKEKADYVVLLDHEGGKGVAHKDNIVAVFRNNGDAIFSHSTRSLGSAVRTRAKPSARTRVLPPRTRTKTRWACHETPKSFVLSHRRRSRHNAPRSGQETQR